MASTRAAIWAIRAPGVLGRRGGGPWGRRGASLAVGMPGERGVLCTVGMPGTLGVSLTPKVPGTPAAGRLGRRGWAAA